MLPEAAPRPSTALEKLVLKHVPVDLEAGLELQCERVRAWLRCEIDHRLRELARREPADVSCSGCGEPVEVSRGQAEIVARGSRPEPRCPACKSPELAAREDAEVARLVEQLGESARELAGALAGLVAR